MKKPSANKKAKTDDANSKVRKREDDKEDDGIDSRNSVHLQTRWSIVEEDDNKCIVSRNARRVVPPAVPLCLPVGALPSGVRTRDNDDDDNNEDDDDSDRTKSNAIATKKDDSINTASSIRSDSAVASMNKEEWQQKMAASKKPKTCFFYQLCNNQNLSSRQGFSCNECKEKFLLNKHGTPNLQKSLARQSTRKNKPERTRVLILRKRDKGNNYLQEEVKAEVQAKDDNVTPNTEDFYAFTGLRKDGVSAVLYGMSFTYPGITGDDAEFDLVELVSKEHLLESTDVVIGNYAQKQMERVHDKKRTDQAKTDRANNVQSKLRKQLKTASKKYAQNLDITTKRLKKLSFKIQKGLKNSATTF